MGSGGGSPINTQNSNSSAGYGPGTFPITTPDATAQQPQVPASVADIWGPQWQSLLSQAGIMTSPNQSAMGATMGQHGMMGPPMAPSQPQAPPMPQQGVVPQAGGPGQSPMGLPSYMQPAAAPGMGTTSGNWNQSPSGVSFQSNAAFNTPGGLDQGQYNPTAAGMGGMGGAPGFQSYAGNAQIAGGMNQPGSFGQSYAQKPKPWWG